MYQACPTVDVSLVPRGLWSNGVCPMRARAEKSPSENCGNSQLFSYAGRLVVSDVRHSRILAEESEIHGKKRLLNDWRNIAITLTDHPKLVTHSSSVLKAGFSCAIPH